MPTLSEEETTKVLASALQAPAAAPLPMTPGKGPGGQWGKFYIYYMYV